MTPRRIEVLVLAANGHSNAEIANLLFVSADTVARHLQKIYMVLGARDRAHAVALGIKRGFIRPDQVRPLPPAVTAVGPTGRTAT
jgi:DNA-binding NarL/FixJ family response regulator